MIRPISTPSSYEIGGTQEVSAENSDPVVDAARSLINQMISWHTFHNNDYDSKNDCRIRLLEEAIERRKKRLGH